MEAKITTQHPEGKKGVNISRVKYDIISKFILDSLRERRMTFSELTEKAHDTLSNSFDGKITWYLVTIKLDLEARGEIERVHGVKPQCLQLKNP